MLLALAALGHGMEPKLLDNPAITIIAQRVHKNPRPGCACLGDTTRYSSPDHLDPTLTVAYDIEIWANE